MNTIKLITRALITAAVIVTSMTARAQINTDQVLRVGQNALYFEDYMLSIQYFNRLIEAKPYLAQPYFYRSIAKLNLEDYSGAEADADLAIERNPFITDAYEVRGVARQNQGKTKEAIEDYDIALSQLPNNRGIMFNKALAQEDIKDLEGASATLDKLIEVYPGFSNAYVGRAKVRLELGDTLSATGDLDKAIELNKNSANAYVMRADLAIKTKSDYAAARADMDEAIKLQPRFAGYFINRAYLRYNLDDYFGAMADYDYALTLDPLSAVAYFNRGLLRAEVSDNDRAIDDFSKVLQIDPNDIRSRYNRAQLFAAKRDFESALADIDKVVDAFPDMSAPRFMRFEIYDKMGNKAKAMRDYDKGMALSKAENAKLAEDRAQAAGNAPSEDRADKAPVADEPATESSELFANRFTTLLTIDNELTDEREFNNKNIRGKVQDRDVSIEIEPSFIVSYYSSPTELAPTTYYMQEVDRLNSTRQLRNVLQVTNRDAAPDEESTINRHFASIEYYNSRLSGDNPRAIDYFGRAMDQFTLHNYDAAIADFNRAIALTPDFAVAYFMRAAAASRNRAVAPKAETVDAAMALSANRALLASIIDDYDTVIRLDPRSPFPHYNKGNLYVETQDLTSALSAYTKAIELKPDFGEAYYNRGYVYFKLGNREAGTADLSRAGQLGILPSYNLLKRMSR